VYYNTERGKAQGLFKKSRKQSEIEITGASAKKQKI
jgi:hypothetical protein